MSRPATGPRSIGREGSNATLARDDARPPTIVVHTSAAFAEHVTRQTGMFIGIMRGRNRSTRTIVDEPVQRHRRLRVRGTGPLGNARFDRT